MKSQCPHFSQANPSCQNSMQQLLLISGFSRSSAAPTPAVTARVGRQETTWPCFRTRWTDFACKPCPCCRGFSGTTRQSSRNSSACSSTRETSRFCWAFSMGTLASALSPATRTRHCQIQAFQVGFVPCQVLWAYGSYHLYQIIDATHISSQFFHFQE